MRLESYYSFFFFQAEDGIRDKLVTGVQTCALPIFYWEHSLGSWWFIEPQTTRHDQGVASFGLWIGPNGRYPTVGVSPTRSEERRVGKECRSRWSPYH